MNYNTVYVGMDVHKETFSLCCYTNEKEQAEYSQKVDAHYSKVLNYLEAMRFHYGDDVMFIRTLLVEAAQSCTRGKPGYKSKALKAQQNGNPADIIAYADKANERLRRRYYQLVLGQIRRLM